MRTEILYKIPNGKMVRLYLDFDTTLLNYIQICGDFFVHPEETISEMERALTRIPIESGRGRVKGLLDRVVENNDAELIGVDTQSLADLICEAMNP